ncbi:hypothetical protein PSV08DRAFT_244880 [Bipolaris maydis]|uniref:uncharacterized protein n=1 Tax=Cochliobolus heterostrophus TaxID=5016 RepID=UPI0024DC5C1C|nr:hypothetical protein J3E74DRAFT_290756 [Bipolaris maydis]KAJ6273682.1 hypothetical protein PSV08DRAFT_244880 [Bipolaris maydis]KAJ6284899.1 hypothetical protein J3E71DRAFT_237890 [Bipolaris maydis]
MCMGVCMGPGVCITRHWLSGALAAACWLRAVGCWPRGLLLSCLPARRRRHHHRPTPCLPGCPPARLQITRPGCVVIRSVPAYRPASRALPSRHGTHGTAQPPANRLARASPKSPAPNKKAPNGSRRVSFMSSTPSSAMAVHSAPCVLPRRSVSCACARVPRTKPVSIHSAAAIPALRCMVGCPARLALGVYVLVSTVALAHPRAPLAADAFCPPGTRAPDGKKRSEQTWPRAQEACSCLG